MKIFCITPIIQNACSFYRVTGPLWALHKSHKLEVSCIAGGEKVEWERLSLCDVFFGHSLYWEHHLQAVLDAKNLGIPVWLDYDDDILNVTSDHCNWKEFRVPRIKDDIKRMCELADWVSVSQESLKDVYGQYTDKISIVPNAIQDEFLRFRKELEFPRKKIAWWRGLSSHSKALYHFAPAVITLAHDNPDWHWVFAGQDPWQITQDLKEGSWTVLDEVPPQRYLPLINENQPAISFVLHCDNAFSRGRGNGAWFEAAFAGAKTIAPDFPTWRKPGVCLYSCLADFSDKMQSALSTPVEPEEINNAWNYILENNLLSVTNKQRVNILRTITGRDL